jgi:hypothetical protein
VVSFGKAVGMFATLGIGKVGNSFIGFPTIFAGINRFFAAFI